MSLAETHPDIAAQWHPENEKGPEEYTPGSHFKAKWLCPNTCEYGCTHEYKSDISSRTYSGNGCPYCSGRNVCIHNSLSWKNIDLAQQWHPTKNGDLRPCDVTPYSHKKVWWLCPNTCEYGCTHEWEVRINTRANGNGCPYCRKSPYKICKHQSFAWKFPDLYEKLWDKERSKICGYEVTPYSNKKAFFKCKKCLNSKLCIIQNISNGQGYCLTCSGHEKKTDELFRQQVFEMYNGKYTPITIYKSIKALMTFKCHEHNKEYEQTPNNFLQGAIGCPKCQPIGWSRAAQEWIESVESAEGVHIQHAPREQEKVIGGYKVDGWCEETQTIYEFHGDYWHGNPKKYQWRMDEVNMSNGKTFGQLYDETCKKTQHLRSLGYRVIEKWETSSV